MNHHKSGTVGGEEDVKNVSLRGVRSVGGQFSSTNEGGTNYGLDFVANVPIIEDTLALRVTGRVDDWDGYVDNVWLGVEDVNDIHTH